MESMKEEVQKAVEGGRDKMYKATEELNMAITGTTTMEGGAMHSQMGHGGQVSHAEALGTWLPLAHPNTLARMQVRERQMLMDEDLLVNTNHLETLSECELVTKANEAIVKLLEPPDQGPKEAKAMGAKKL